MATRKSPGDPPGGRLRRLPLPDSQPPFDDELARPAASAALPAASAALPAAEAALPAGEAVRPDGETVRPAPVQGALALSIDLGEPPEPVPLRLLDHPSAAAPALPDPRRWTARLAQAAIEGVHGRRSVQQLIRWTDEAVYKALARRAAQQPATPAVRPRIRAIRVCQVTDTVAEASVVVQLGRVARGVAVRLEAVDDRWLCTAFEIVEPVPARRGRRGQRLAHSSSNATA